MFIVYNIKYRMVYYCIKIHSKECVTFSQHCVYVILEISLETYTNNKYLVFCISFNTPIDCVSYGIYTQQIDAVSRFMVMCYLLITLYITCTLYVIVC